jgi:tetratricopeptide (TPR) repeat protein
MDDMKDMGPYVTNELNAITPIELHQWAKLETLKPAPGTAAWSIFDIYWGQGVGAGHLRDAKTASAALAQFDAARAALKGTPIESMTVSLEIPHNELVAWQAFAEGRNDAALIAMRAAADQQDKLGQGEVDIPAREMLGDLLMEMHQPQQALAEYEVALKLSPNRLNGLLSAGAAAEAIGNPQLAETYYAQAARNTDDAAESKRPDLLHAVAFTRRHAVTTEAE